MVVCGVSEKGKIVKSKDDQGKPFWYVTFPGERAEEFDTEKEANEYLADMAFILFLSSLL